MVGAQVILAARIEPVAYPGEVWVTEQFKSLIDPDRDRTIQFDPLGERPLAKKFGSKRLFRLCRVGESAIPRIRTEEYPIRGALVLRERKVTFTYEENGHLRMTSRRIVENWTKQPVRILRLERAAEFLPFPPEDLDIREPYDVIYYPPPSREEPRQLTLEKCAEHNYEVNLTPLAKGEPNVRMFEWQYVVKEGSVEENGGRLEYTYDLVFKGGLERAKEGTQAGVTTLEFPEEEVSVFLKVVPSNYEIHLGRHFGLDQLGARCLHMLKGPVLEQERRALKWEIGNVPPYVQCLFQFRLEEST